MSKTAGLVSQNYRQQIMGEAAFLRRELLSRIGGDSFLLPREKTKYIAIEGIFAGPDPIDDSADYLEALANRLSSRRLSSRESIPEQQSGAPPYAHVRTGGVHPAEGLNRLLAPPESTIQGQRPDLYQPGAQPQENRQVEDPSALPKAGAQPQAKRRTCPLPHRHHLNPDTQSPSPSAQDPKAGAQPQAKRRTCPPPHRPPPPSPDTRSPSPSAQDRRPQDTKTCQAPKPSKTPATHTNQTK